MSFIKRHKIAVAIAVVVLIVIVFAFSSRGNGGGEAVMVSTGELVRTVELAGKVVPAEDADLAFEVTGTVARTYKKVGDKVMSGDIIVELDQSGTRADYLKANADLAAAQAELAKLSGGNDLQAKVTNSKTSVTQNIIDAFTDADDAISNKIDQFFEDARTPNPKIVFSFDDYTLRNKINDTRVRVGTILTTWKASVSKLSVATYTEADLETAKVNLREISLFLDDVARAVNSFKPNASVTQTLIDKYKTDVAAARQNINGASATLISGEESYSATLSDVPVQVARVAAAEATLATYQARLGKMTLRSPITGIVSKQDAKTGESVSANTNLVSVISADYKLEAYVPEVSVAGIVVGAKAKVTLDAYGKDVVFDATIIHVDPRETIRDGVSTYKIELVFSSPDSRILSGLTSNISIETLRTGEVLYIPARSVLNENGKKTVKVKISDKEVVTREIVTGISDTKGNVEIVSGLSASESVVVNPK